MSVVAWDGKTLAADRQCVDGDLCYPASKIRQLPGGIVVAICGYMDTGLAMVRWFEDGADPDDFPSTQNDKDTWSTLLVMYPTGELCRYRRTSTPEPIIAVPMCWGAGADIAFGAMAMGADARRAVEIAIQYSQSCGFGVEAFDVVPQVRLTYPESQTEFEATKPDFCATPFYPYSKY